MTLPRLIAVDMDGTFLHDDHSYDVARFKRVFEQLRARGVRFAASSGNQYWLMRSRFPETFHDMGFVADNGSCVWVGDELLFSSTMQDDTARLALDALCAYMSDDICCIADGIESSWVPSTQPREFFDFMSNFNLRIAWTDNLYALDDKLLKCALILPETIIDGVIDELNERFAGRLVAVKSAPICIDIVQPGINKATGLERLAHHWGIRPDECMCFGDSGNDIEMFRWCGCSYAMANADPALLSLADRVCPSNEDDGVLQTLESLLRESEEL